QGNGGNDTFIYNPGYGALEINEQDWNSTAANTLKLGPGLTAASVALSIDANGDVVLTDGLNGDRIQIDAMATRSYSGVQQLQFDDGTVWNRRQIFRAATSGGTPNATTLT